MKILLIDDSEDTGLLVQRCLSPYEVEQAFSLREAMLRIASNQYNLLLIDVSLPDGDGFSFCEELMRTGQMESVPKIFLSAHSATADKVFGLNCGADDYVTKPFELAELRARVDSRLRQVKAVAAEPIFKPLAFESSFQRCTYESPQGEVVDLQLTPTEFRLLWVLAGAQGKPLTRQEIVRAVWTHNGMNIEVRGIDSHVAHLRKKLPSEAAEIVSVYGRGYVLKFKSSSEGKVG